MPQPCCERILGTHFALSGPVADTLRGVSEQWLRIAPLANPGMLEMFRDRDRQPLRDLVPWAGEFAGKYLTAAVQVLRLTGDEELRAVLRSFVAELVGLQAEDGYLGPWPKTARLTGHAPNGEKGTSTWDAWGHYHVMLGLLLWHEETSDPKALACARRIGDLLCNKFLGKTEPGERLVDTGSTEMNLAPVHSLCLLYEKTRTRKHLDLALQIVDEFSARAADGTPLAGDYLNAPLAGKEFFQTPKPRWESLHPILGLAELHYLTGDPRCRDAFTRLWRSMVSTDRHNTGGFTAGEQAQGNPYHQGAIETCCCIAWLALTVDMLRLTGDPLVADELELTTLNTIIGAHSHTGRWATYDTPMDGVRRASAHHIVFQSREGTPELNCCSVNAPRGLGLISDWALMRDSEGLRLNWYGPGTIRAPLSRQCSVTLALEGDYPRSGRVALRVSPSRATEFCLKLRIPRWSRHTLISVNGRPLKDIAAGTYLPLTRTWKKGDTVSLSFDMGFHAWPGERECAGKASLYRGPILLACDRRYNDFDLMDLPELDAAALKARPVRWKHWIPPMMLLEFAAADGRKVRLCDFASAGEGGSPYLSWLRIKDAATLPKHFTGRAF